jgi:hypothetical protein
MLDSRASNAAFSFSSAPLSRSHPSTPLLAAFSSSEDAVPLPVDVAVPLLVDVDALDAVDGLPVVVLVLVDVDASWPGLTCS